MVILNYIIAAAGGVIGGALGIAVPTAISKKTGYSVDSEVQKLLNKNNEEEVQVDEDGNPIVKAVEITEEPIFHAVKEEKPKSPFKAKKAEKNVNGVETVEPENK